MPGVKSQLRSAIDSIGTKSAQASAARDDANSSAFSKTIAADRASASHNAVRIKESIVMARERDLDNILQQLSPPPTKDIDTGGKNGGTKTVVDKEEVARLQREKTNIMGQLQNAKNDVAEARDTAASDTATALEKAGISNEKQAAMASLMSQLNSMNDNLANGQEVSDDEITGLLDRFNEATGDLDREDNQAGAISKAFYNPFKQGLQTLLGHLNDPTAPRNTDPDTSPPPGTIDHDLEQVGITGQKADDIIAFVERTGNISTELQNGTPFTEAEMQLLYDDHQTLTQGLSSTQLASQPLTELQQSVYDVVIAAGHRGILPAGAQSSDEIAAGNGSPDSSTPDASTPDASTPDASTPDASTPDASTPDASTPDASTPDASTPDASTPDASTPDASTPDASTPDASTPDSSTPDASTPDASTPDSSTPDASTPDASTPDSSTPDASTPDASTPDDITTGSSSDSNSSDDSDSQAINPVNAGAGAE